MDRAEDPETAQRQPPPTSEPRARRGDRPWHNRVPPPPPPALPPHLAGEVDLRVGKRLLWVGGAAYPLRNITRVYTFLLTPRRGAATVLFLKRVAIIILAAAFATVFLTGVTLGMRDVDTETTTALVVTGTVIALLYCVVELLMVLSAQSHWVLAVETSGASTAMVTSRNTQHLNALVGYVVHAIENPEVEFKVKVESLMVNHRNYHFGDNVNIYGGSGNTGVAKP